MRYLNDFNNFGSLNEDKTSRAERKRKNAEELLNDIDNAINSGDDKKAERLMRRAARKIDKAESLDPSIDTEEISNRLISLKTELDDEKQNPDDNFELKSKKHRNKIKADEFDIINKIKILGNEISNDEVQGFLKTVKTYLNEYWNELKDGNNFPEEYQSPYTDFTLHVKRKFGRTVFLYKESNTDKIKIVFTNKDFSNDEYKNTISTELDDVIDSENIKREIEDNYQPEKDDIKVEAPKEEQLTNIVAPSPVVKSEIEKVATILTTKDDIFINNTVNFLIKEELNVGFSNTDEDKIYDYFVKNNAKKIIVPENVNDILIKYRQKKATMNEAWYNDTDDLVDATVGATNRATQSTRTQESKGVVGDLMWAFNTDARTLSDDINKALLKISSAYQKELNKSIDKLKNNQVKEAMDTSSILTGMMASGFALKSSPKLAKLVGLRGAATGTGSTVARGGLAGVSRLGALLGNPYVWIAIAVVAAIGGGWYLWNSLDEQQDQLATIFLLMWASGSQEFHKELKMNGIIIKAPKIDVSKLNNLIKSGELFGGEPQNTETGNLSHLENKRIKRFTDFK